MRLTRIHIPSPEGASTPAPLAAGREVELPAAAGEHVARVLRLRVGAAVVLFDGHGGEWAAEITSIARNRVRALCRNHNPVERESPVAITLLQSLARGEKMDWIIQKATELGVHDIIPVSSERSVVHMDEQRESKRLAHWQAIAASACEQCGRNRLPELSPPMALPNALELQLPNMRLTLSPAAVVRLRDVVNTPQAIALLVGPEGGLTEQECAHSEARGFRAVRFGPRILRTETAAVAAIAALQLLTGDL